MTDFNWTIANIEYTNDDNKAVTIAHWRVTAQDGEYTASSTVHSRLRLTLIHLTM